jgi:hypothetical protein
MVLKESKCLICKKKIIVTERKIRKGMLKGCYVVSTYYCSIKCDKKMSSIIHEALINEAFEKRLKKCKKK